MSNCGLVIVQVQPDPNHRYEQRPQYHYAEQPQQPQQPQSLTNWSNITLDNRIFLTETGMGQHGQPQILQDDPAQIVEVEAVDEDDEGYRTSPGSGNSPQSSNSNESSPQPQKISGGGLKKARPTASSKTVNGLRKDGDENNLMWLLDFKLDFFNEAEAHGKDKGTICLSPL